MACIIQGNSAKQVSNWLCNYGMVDVGEDLTVNSTQREHLTLLIETKYYKTSVDVLVLSAEESSKDHIDTADAFVYVLTTEEVEANENIEVQITAGTKLCEEKGVATREV